VRIVGAQRRGAGSLRNRGAISRGAGAERATDERLREEEMYQRVSIVGAQRRGAERATEKRLPEEEMSSCRAV